MKIKSSRIDQRSAIWVILFEIVIGMIWSCISFLLFLDLAKGVLNDSFIQLDTALSYAIYSIRSPVMTRIMEGISYLGNDGILFFMVMVGIILSAKKHKHEAFLCVILVGMGIAFNTVFKAIFARARPDLKPLLPESFYSFPSGHSMNSFIFFTILAFLVFRFTRKKRLSMIIAIGCLVLILLIGFSRIYLGVHYPTDIIAGYIAGFWLVVTVLVVDKSLFFLKEYRILR